MPWVQRPRPGIPSYETNFAGPDRLPPANPNLWDGLIYNWHGPLGVTGISANDIKDTSGRQNHGTPSNMVASDWAMTDGCYALDFDGNADDEYIPLPDSSISDGLAAFSVSALVRFDSASAGAAGDGIVSKWDDSTDKVFLLWRANGTAELRFRQYNSSGSFDEAIGLVPVANQWYSVVGVYDGASVLLYVDGKLQSTVGSLTGVTQSGSAQDLFIGSYDQSQLNTMLGQLSSVAMWNRALAPNEIQQLFVDTHAITRPMQRLFVGGGAAAANIVVLRRRMEAA